jgi:hypothetical protein
MADALFTMMRFNVLTAALNPHTASRFTDAYVYAWDALVYPAMDDGADWHHPFKDDFRVTLDMMVELSKFLDDLWLAKKTISFWKLEEHFQVRHGNGPWDRSALLHACKYFRLYGMFDDDFFDALTKNGESPVEAQSIVSKWDRDGELYLM